MQSSPLELKETLLRHLDSDYNVVDMQGVLNVICALERYPITKEHLEQTRIGKVVNELRRKTTDRNLAKRGKDLVRSWQSLLVDQPLAPVPHAGQARRDLSRVSSGTSLSSMANGVRSSTDRSANGHGSTVRVPDTYRPTDSRSRLSEDRTGRTGSQPCTPVTTPSQIPSSGYTSKPATPSLLHHVASSSKLQERCSTPTDAKINSARDANSLPLSRSASSYSYAPKPLTPAAGSALHPAASTSRLKVPDRCATPDNPKPNSAYVRSASLAATASGRSTPNAYLPKPATPLLTSSSKPPTFERSLTPAESSYSSKSTPAATRPIANGLDSASYALDDRGKISGKRKLNDYPDDVTDVKRPCTDVRNGTVKSASVLPASTNGIWSVHHNADTNGSDDARPSTSVGGNGVDPKFQPRITLKINRTSASGSVSSPAANSPSAVPPPVVRSKVPKVATTAQLIQKLHASNELRLVASDTLNRIATNQIEREIDEPRASVVPEGAKPRPHKKRRSQQPPAMTDADLQQVKEERVRTFLQMSADVSPPAADSDLLGLLGRLAEDASESAAAPIDVEASAEHEEAVPDVDSYEAVLMQLPDLDNFEVDWESDVYTAPGERRPPTDADVDRLIAGEWPSVGGQYDHRGAWADWTRTYSVPTYNGDLLHILPYVDLGD